jgi:hypothetical protein
MRRMGRQLRRNKKLGWMNQEFQEIEKLFLKKINEPCKEFHLD